MGVESDLQGVGKRTAIAARRKRMSELPGWRLLEPQIIRNSEFFTHNAENVTSRQVFLHERLHE